MKMVTLVVSFVSFFALSSRAQIISEYFEADSGKTKLQIMERLAENAPHIQIKCMGFTKADCMDFAKQGANIVLNDPNMSHFDQIDVINSATSVDKVTVVSGGFNGHELANAIAPSGVKLRLRSPLSAYDIRQIIRSAPVKQRVQVEYAGYSKEEIESIRELLRQ